MGVMDPHIPSLVKDKSLKMDSELEDRLVTAYGDIGLLGKMFFPNRFRMPYTSIHLKLIDFINEAFCEQFKLQKAGKPCGIKRAVVGTRGLAKTSFFQLLIPARTLLYRLSHFNVFITKSLGNTVMQTENLKRALTQSNDFKVLLGSVRETSRAMSETFGKESWIVCMERWYSMQLPRGRGQEVRGLNFDDYRPEFISLDDLETKIELRNPDIRQATKEYLDTDVIEAVSQFEAENIPYQIWATDTAKHHDSGIEYLIKRPDFVSLRIPICDENYQTLASDFMSQDTMDKQVAWAKKSGTLDTWSQEHRAVPGAKENAPFQRTDFRYYKESEGFPCKSNWLEHFVLVDLSKTMKTTSDDCAILGLTVDFQNYYIYLRDLISDKMSVLDQVRLPLEMCLRYNSHFLGVEVHGVDDWAEQPYKDAISRYRLFGLTFVPVKIKHGKDGEFKGDEGSKAGRAIPLSSYTHNHRVFINMECTTLTRLEDALCQIPECTDWHCVDAFSALLYMFKKLGLGFDPPEVALGLEGIDGPKVGAFEDQRRWAKGQEGGDLESIFDSYFAPSFDYALN